MLVKNEKACLEKMLPTLPLTGFGAGYDKLIAVDGGSTDGSQQLLIDAGIDIFNQTKRGRGAAILEVMQSIDADAFIFFSPDGNEDIADLPKFRGYLNDGADLVIASRMMPGAHNEEDANILKFRKWANLTFNKLANIFFGAGLPFVTDSINGYRAITKKLAKKLNLDALDYTIEYQMTIRALKVKSTIVEFPTHEGQRLAGVTGASSIPTGLRFIKRLLIELKT